MPSQDLNSARNPEEIRLTREAEKEQERKDLALLAYGCVDHIGDVLVDLESYLDRLAPLMVVGAGRHQMSEIVDQATQACRNTYGNFKHLLTAADRLNRYAKPTMYDEAGQREDARAKERWSTP